jgi:4-amino-4-deoxy-L-arabinose transferase-like glycosyltransferase
MSFSLNKKTIFFLIILSGTILRFYNINYDNLWYDEIISFWVANPNHSFEDSLIFHKQIEIAPYAFNFILKYFYQIFGYDVNYARYLPAFFSVLTIAIVFQISKEIDVKENTHLLATFLTSFNIFLISYAQEQRLYSILIFFVLTSILFFLRLQKKNPDIIDLIFFIITSICLIILHLFSVFIIFSFILYQLLIFIKKKEQFFRLNLALGFLSILVLIYYIPYVISFSNNLDSNLDVNYSWNKNPSIKFLTNFYFSNFFGSRLLGLIFLTAFIFLIFLGRKSFLRVEKISIFLIVIISSYLIPIIFGFLFAPILLPRYVSYIPVLVIILISFLSFNIQNVKRRRSLIILLIVFTIGNMFTEQAFKQFVKERVPSKPQYVEALKSIQKSNLRNYFIKVENMKDNVATITSINNYISHLSSKFNLKLNYIESVKFMQSSLWIMCPMDINEKDCVLPDEFKNYQIIEEKNFNSINLKLISND